LGFFFFFNIHLNDIFEAGSAVTGQTFAFASPTQILTMGPFRVNVAEFYSAGASSLFTTLTGDILHSVRVLRLLTSSAKLLEVNLVGALHTPHVGTFPSDV